MRKFKGKRRHRNKANAQAQSSPAAKMSDAQQPSVSGLGLHAEVDLDDRKDTPKVQDASPSVGQANEVVSDGITSPPHKEELKGGATEEREERVEDESSDKEGKSEDNNNEKSSDEINTFQEGKGDKTLTNGLEDDVGDHGGLDDPVIIKEDVDDDQKDLFIVEEADQIIGIDDNKNNVSSTKLDGSHQNDESSPDKGSSKTELPVGDEMKDASAEISNENETFDQSSYESAETAEPVNRSAERPTEYSPEESQRTNSCGEDDDVKYTQADLNIAEGEKETRSSPQTTHSPSDVRLETKEDAESQRLTNQQEADERGSTSEAVRYASCSDEINDEAVETESAITKLQAPLDQSDFERGSSSSSERTESVDHDQFEDAHEIPDEEDEAAVGDEAADGVGEDVSQEKMRRTSPTITDDVFVTETVDTETVPDGSIPGASVCEETDVTTNEVVEELKELDQKRSETTTPFAHPVGENIQENNHFCEEGENQREDQENKIPSSPGLSDGNDESNPNVNNSPVAVGSSVDSHLEIDGTSVDSGLDNKVDNGVDIKLNPLDTSGDDKDPVMDTLLQEEESCESPDPSTMCPDPTQQQQGHDQQQQNVQISQRSDGEHLQPLQQSSQSDPLIKEQQQQEELQQQEQRQQQQQKQQQQQQQQELLQQQKQEIEHLQEQLREKQEAMTRLQAHAHAQQIQANLLTTSLRTKLRRKEQDLKSVKSQHETCISAVISHLLYLEGQMQTEHKQVIGVLKEKDDVIRRQKVALEDVTDKNDQLVMALKESNGYDVTDNGLSRPPLPVVTQNGKYSIQDHGNKVVLRGNKVTNGGHKVRFSSMKERLRRHKSSLELYHTEPLEPLVEGTLRYFGSQENLVDGDTGYLETRTKSAYINARKQRCRSMIEGQSDLQEADEIHNESPDSCFGEESLSSENISQSDSYSLGPSPPTSSSYYYGKRSESVPSNIGLNQLAKSRSVPQALPTVSEKDGVGGRSWQSRERPHSLPSAGMLVGGRAGLVTGSPKVSVSPSMSIPTTAAIHLPPSSSSSSTSSSSSSMSSSSQPTPTTTSSSSSSSISESNPFKSFKNVFKRRGSKKKRSVSLGQATNQQYQDSIKQHFKKYDLT